MLANDVDHDRLRRLAGLRPDGAKVLSVYINRDPETFASPRALTTEAHSALDEAGRAIEAAGLDHQALIAARADLERLRELLLDAPDDGSDDVLDANLDLKGARGLAIFACGPADLLEVLKLPAPVPTRVVLGTSPAIEPLVRAHPGRERVVVALVDREHARLFSGTQDALEEIDDPAARQRHREVRDVDAQALFKTVSEDLLALLNDRGFDVLVVDVLGETRRAFEDELHPYVRERLGGEIRVEITSATADDVRRAVAEVLAERRDRHAGEVLARLREGLGRGERAAAGLDDVRSALEQRRVEALVYEATRQFDGLDDLVDAAVLQDAEILTVDPTEHPELGPHGGIGAVLRF